MYTRYFGFNEKPFTLTPNPRFIFLSKNHKEAFAHLLYGINSHYGFIELTGEVGTGKTTVLRTLLGQFQDENYRCALIFNPCLTAVELLRSINQEFGITTSSDCINDLLAGLNRFLLDENNQGRTVVLVIDESQNLHTEVLEQLRLISNLETESDKLIQIILAGQPELETILRQRNLRQLNQRIAVRYRLRPLEKDETRAYILHRMEIAGKTGGVTFTNAAMAYIHLYSRGIPRMINILCDRALLIAYGDEQRRVSCITVIRAIAELLGVSAGRYVLAGLVATVLTVIALTGSSRYSGWPWKQRIASSPVSTQNAPRPFPAKNVPVAIAKPFQQSHQLEQELLKHDLNEVHIQACNALLTSWNAQPIRIFKGTLTSPGTFSRLAAKRHLRCTVFKGSLDDVINFNLPFLIVTKISGRSGRYYLAVTAASGDSVSVSPPLLGSGGILSRNDLASIADGVYYLLWKNSGHIPDRIQRGDKNFELRYFQRLLKQAGFYHEVINGEYNDATTKALVAFQQSKGISANETMGELTLTVLSTYDTSVKAPSLKGS
ncbi:MAG: AAA family ATPase [Desulfuromonadales bacterium]|nr:AAA family ATPase [Desulfuromonadales bacterium]